MVETINRVNRISRRLTQELGREPTAEEIALEMDILPQEERRLILEAQARGEPLDPVLSRHLKRAALKVRRIMKISQEPMSLWRCPSGRRKIPRWVISSKTNR